MWTKSQLANEKILLLENCYKANQITAGKRREEFQIAYT